ncbi:hypothetical protein [Brevibacterium spongiae]|uniref:Secreted protein n=1 Tax=Brevibacterium spongiae TaxID=2909672 RepID=A0ABY5SQE6_9MICO|nr:hypothetical protein [Brevibacterium spongiae]UVI36782.1 hypothetical protein L1F31_03735 [Brevibacterium spongiae]
MKKTLALAATAAISLSALTAGPAAAAGHDHTDSSNAALAVPAADAQDDSAKNGDSGEESNPVEASLALKYSYMNPMGFSSFGGIQYTIDSLEEGDIVTNTLTDEIDRVDKDGPYDGSIMFDREPEADTTVDFTVTVERDGERKKEFPASIDVVEGDRGASADGDVIIDNDELTVADFKQFGIDLTVVQCPADSTANFKVAKKDAPNKVLKEKSQLVGEDESASVHVVPPAGVEDHTGEYAVMTECGDLKSEGTFTIKD